MIIVNNVGCAFFKGSVRFCMINDEIRDKIYGISSYLRKVYCEIDVAQWSRNITKLTTNHQGINQYSILVVSLSVYSMFSYLLSFLINKLRRLKIYILKGEKSGDVSGDGNRFYRPVALRRDETGNEKHEEISRSSSSFFQKNPRVSELLPLVTVS